MVNWIEPVIDRDLYDIEYARNIINNWTSGEIEGLKGCLNYSDLNRIENNIEFLSDRLNEYYYINNISERKIWVEAELFDIDNINRILNDILELLTSFNYEIQIPDSMLHYEEINTIEEILYIINEYLNEMENCFQKSGVFVSGSKRILPVGGTI